MTLKDKALALVEVFDKPFYGNGGGTSCVIHRDRPWAHKPHSCDICHRDLRNRLSYLEKINAYLHKRCDNSTATVIRELLAEVEKHETRAALPPVDPKEVVDNLARVIADRERHKWHQIHVADYENNGDTPPVFKAWVELNYEDRKRLVERR